MLFKILVLVVMIVNMIIFVKMNEIINRLEDNLVDIEITYLKQQAVLREIKDMFSGNE